MAAVVVEVDGSLTGNKISFRLLPYLQNFNRVGHMDAVNDPRLLEIRFPFTIYWPINFVQKA